MILQKIQQRVDEELLARKYLDYSRRLLRKLEKQLRELEKEATEQGKWKPSQLHEADRIDNYMAQLRQEVKQYNEMLNLRLGSDLVSIYISEHQWTQQFLNEIVSPSVTYNFNRVSTGAVKKLLSGMTITDGKGRARTLQDYLTGYSKDLAGQSEKVIMDSIALGDSIDNTVAELRQLHKTVSRNRLETTVRTWAVKAHTEANLDVYREADVKRVQWCAALDMRTCATCAAKDGKLYNLSQLQKAPPIHPRCRCCLLPIVDSNDIFIPKQNGYQAWLADENRSPEELLELRKRVLRERGIHPAERREMVNIIDESLKSKGVTIPDTPVRKVKAPKVKMAMAPAKPVYQKAQSLLEAQNWAQKELGLDFVTYGRMNLDMANQLNQALADIVPRDQLLNYVGTARGYQEYVERLTGVKVKYSRLPDGVAAMYRETFVGGKQFRALLTEEHSLKDYLSAVEKGWTKGNLVPENIREIVAHEWGHYIALNSGKYTIDKKTGIIEETRFIFQNPDLVKRVAKEVSKYAASDHKGHELLAELYAMKVKGLTIPDFLRRLVP